MSLGERGVFNRAYAPLLFEVETLPFPEAGADQATLDALESLARAADTLAALIVEPLLLGAGGMRIYAPEVLAEMREICTRHDVLLIDDRSEEHTSELQSLMRISYADFCLKKKKKHTEKTTVTN